jgi:hypothetical protein
LGDLPSGGRSSPMTVPGAAVQPAGLSSRPEMLAQPVNDTRLPDVRGGWTGGPSTGVRAASGQDSGKKGRLVSRSGWGGGFNPSRPGLKWWLGAGGIGAPKRAHN